jgi:uncharacterized protein YerC
MTRITKRGITKKQNDYILGVLLKKINKCKTVGDFDAILSNLFTAEEKIMLKKRLAISLWARKGKTTKEISESLDVSRTTISFVKRGLKNISKNTDKIKKISRKDYSSKIKHPSLLPSYSSKNRWGFLNKPQI